MSARNPRTGAVIIREWSRTLPSRSAILDLGCGHGVPVSQTLTEEGFTVFGVDASITLIEAYRKRFPSALAECAGVEDSEFFQRTFNGVVACGLMFLMPEDTQSLITFIRIYCHLSECFHSRTSRRKCYPRQKCTDFSRPVGTCADFTVQPSCWVRRSHGQSASC